MAAIATTRQPDATKMPAGGNADGRLHTFNDLRMRLRQNLPFDQWTGILRTSQCRLHCCTVRGGYSVAGEWFRKHVAVPFAFAINTKLISSSSIVSVLFIICTLSLSIINVGAGTAM